MPAMDTLLFNDPEVKGLAFAILEECTDLQAFGRRMLELLANAAMSAKADEACNAPYGERDEGRVNSRNGYRERGSRPPRATSPSRFRSCAEARSSPRT